MKKQYKIQLPKGKAVVAAKTNVDNDNGVMTIDVDFTGKYVNTFGRIKKEKMGKKAKKRINENDKQLDKILKMADDKDVRAVANMILQEYEENLCRQKQHECLRTLSEPKLIDEIAESISKREKELRELFDTKQHIYEPQDGDFVYVSAGFEYIAIFKKAVDDDMYVYANLNISYSIPKINTDDSRLFCCIHDLSNIRPATEEEKELLIDKLAERNKKWNAETKQIEDVRWRAGMGKPYCYILGLDNIVGTTDERFECDDNRYFTNNYFKTREAAERVTKQIREIIKNSKAE